MTTLRIGDQVAHQGRVYYVRGFSPMSISPRRLLLEDTDARQIIEIAEAELANGEVVATETGPEASGSGLGGANLPRWRSRRSAS